MTMRLGVGVIMLWAALSALAPAQSYISDWDTEEGEAAGAVRGEPIAMGDDADDGYDIDYDVDFDANADGEWTDDDDAMEFALGDALYTMYHEAGHMLVGELDLPVLGKEEDAVDALAVVMMLSDEEDLRSYDRLISAIDGWYLNSRSSGISSVDDIAYFSNHSLNIQRTYNMLCLMVGKDAEYFAFESEYYEMDQDQVESCYWNFEDARDGWTKVLEDHASEGGPRQIEVIYEEPEDPLLLEFMEAYQTAGMLERTADRIESLYTLPGPVTFRAMECGEENAWYSPSESQVVICYDMSRAIRDLYLEAIGEGGVWGG